MSVVLDLFIQDFVKSNQIQNQHVDWNTLVNRRFAETPGIKVFSFESGGAQHFAVGQMLVLPDAEWFRIELFHTAATGTDEHRFEMLQMLSGWSHTRLSTERPTDTSLIVQLQTRHRGLVNVLFVIHGEPTGFTHPAFVRG